MACPSTHTVFNLYATAKTSELRTRYSAVKITDIEQFNSFYPKAWLETNIKAHLTLTRLFYAIGAPNPDNFWIWREALRMQLAMYKAIPGTFFDSDYYTNYYPDTKYHFVHISERNPLLIAYTEDEYQGRKDIQTVTKIGKYITRYLPGLDAKSIANQYLNHQSPPELRFARTRSEIRAVYDNGPRSCMKQKRIVTDEGVEVSPTEVYAGPDTAVAFLGTLHQATARCVVNEKRHKWVRVYGDDSYLKELLERAGYTQGTLNGCHVLLLWQEGGYDPIMPYLDGTNTCYVDGDYVKISDQDAEVQYVCDKQDGTVGNFEEEETIECADCWENFPYESEGCNLDHGWVCQSCLNNNYYLAYTCRYLEYVSTENESFWEYQGEYYTEGGLEAHNLVEIEGNIYSSEEVQEDSLDDCVFVVVEEGISTCDSNGDWGYTNFDTPDPRDHTFYFDLENHILYFDIEVTEADEKGLYSVADLLSLFPNVCKSWDIPDTSNRFPYNYLFTKVIAHVIASEIKHQRFYAYSANTFYCERINSQAT